MKFIPFSDGAWRRFLYRARHQYLTQSNALVAVALVVAVSWAWGSVSVLQRNYLLQRKVDAKQRELELAQLEVETLEFQQSFYRTAEFQELEARRVLGLASPGEKVLMLPPNTEEAKKVGIDSRVGAVQVPVRPSNFQQWLDFFGGRNAELIEQ
jgi:cell division protein FtsB